ncbi:hypothetical protein CSOJ01_05662 [Colletotrichum sojae]|uniref:O-methyltransferase C-terminal domain-containing protein n=1 Tax=Colletotrichum sojae TaxID=2175907 RepID=A0A8H6JEB6_9PEZI|nr:hypothetical protein CSOJ01_05662 [Colletotrichum sojae]
MLYITETGPDEYSGTNFSDALTITSMGAGYPCVAGACMEALAKFHEFAKTNYREPHNVFDGPLQYGYKTKLDCFSHFAANPPYDLQFAQHMGAYRQGRPSWMDEGFYPVKERLSVCSTVSTALVTECFSSTSEDLPSVVDQIDKLDVLHDWPDAKCGEILARKMAAMKPGYSKLLVNENCIPDTGADWQNTGQDIMMLTFVSSKERTRVEWQALLERSGLRIVKIYGVGNGVESLIECELA